MDRFEVREPMTPYNEAFEKGAMDTFNADHAALVREISAHMNTDGFLRGLFKAGRDKPITAMTLAYAAGVRVGMELARVRG